MIHNSKKINKVLVLTCKFGLGHYSVGQAVCKNINSAYPNIQTELIDIVEYIHPYTYKMIYKGFGLVCKSGTFYNFVNHFGTKEKKTHLTPFLKGNIRKLLEKYEPDVVVSTWSAATRLIAEYKSAENSSLKLYTFITDMCVHSGWIKNQVDKYFVADDEVKERLIEKNIEAKKIKVIGIPLKEDFYTYKKPTHTEDKKHLLIMGGGLGIIPWVYDLINELEKHKDIKITVIAGKNKKTYRYIKSKFPQIEAVGCTNEVYKYMYNADLLVTKPGGVTVFEAIYANTPMLILYPMYSHEIENARFSERYGIGRIVWESEKDAVAEIIKMVEDTDELNSIKSNMKSMREDFEEKRIQKYFEDEEYGC